MAPNPNSGTADPTEPRRNNKAAAISPHLRPQAVETQPATAAPMMHPTSALEIVQPDKVLRAVSDDQGAAWAVLPRLEIRQTRRPTP